MHLVANTRTNGDASVTGQSYSYANPALLLYCVKQDRIFLRGLTPTLLDEPCVSGMWSCPSHTLDNAPPGLLYAETCRTPKN
jgi:hypothetical protein